MDRSVQRSRGMGENSSEGADVSLRKLFSSLPGGVGGDMARDMDNMEGIRAQGQGEF
jgi:hypothetical protein